MIKLVYKKGLSFIRRQRAFFYSRSSKWRNHPLNIPEPAVDFTRIEQDLAILKQNKIIDDLSNLIVTLEEYNDFKSKFEFGGLYAIRCRDKKVLEHFIAFKLLKLKLNDSYIDVGSQDSPFSRELVKMGIDSFSQDIAYRPGIHNRHIGSSAEKLPVADNSVDRISLQCTFEHFNGMVDTLFIQELKRVLKPAGKCCIVPLYLANVFTNYVDPTQNYSKVALDEGAKVVGEINLGGIFERKYSAEALKERILTKSKGLNFLIFKINADSISVSPLVKRVRYVLLIEKAEQE